jgi:rod shape-determining protein MreD
MVRAALGTNADLGRGPKRLARYWPAASVALASSLSLLPIVTELGWGPDFGFLLMVAWRLLRSDAIPSWCAAPLGLFNDLVTGAPVGLSVTTWTAAMLLLDLAARRTMWRDYWIEWLLAALLLFMAQLIRWRVDALMGAPYDFRLIWSPWIIAVLAFPLAAFAASAIDRWRLGR